MTVINRLTEKDIINKNMASAIEANQSTEFKAAARQFGFKWQMSLYGVLTESETRVSEYRRIEVLSNKPFNAGDIAQLHRFFKNIKPAATYTIWLYDESGEAVTLGISFN